MPSYTVKFSDHLREELENNPPRRKGERTKRRLLLAATRVLEESGYHDLRISDITQAAEASDGSFYVYFKDKKDITLQVLEEFLPRIQNAAERSQMDESPFEQMLNSNLIWIRHVHANAGLMRCVFQMSDEDSDFSRLVHTTNRNWYERVARSVVRNHADGAIQPDAALFASWALGGMSDEMIRRLVVYPDNGFVTFLDENGVDEHTLALSMAVIWFRTLYPDVPMPNELPGLAGQLAAFDKTAPLKKNK